MNDTALPHVPQNNIYGPITSSQMLERTGALLRENFKLFCGIALFIIAVEIVVRGIIGASKLIIDRPPLPITYLARSLFLVLGGVLIYIAAAIVQGALFIATNARLAGAPMSVWQACEATAEKTGRLAGIAISIWLRILAYLMLFLLGIIVIGGAIMLIDILVFHRIGHELPMALAVLATVLLGLFLYWLWARYACSVPAALAENLGVNDAIRRSIYLSRDSKGRLYILFLVVACISIGLAAVTFPVQMMFARGAMLHPAPPTLATETVIAVLAIFRIVASAIVIAIVGIATALCYYDLRARKEEFGASTAAPVLEIPSPVLPPPPNLPAEDFPIS